MTLDQLRYGRVLQSFAWLTAGELIGRAVSFLTVVHLSRVLLPAGMGIVDFGLAVLVVVQIATKGGTEILGARSAARSTRHLRRVAGTVALLGSSSFLVAFSVVASLGWWLPPSPELRTTTILFALASNDE